jgi:hypothetical protein
VQQQQVLDLLDQEQKLKEQLLLKCKQFEQLVQQKDLAHKQQLEALQTHVHLNS